MCQRHQNKVIFFSGC